MLRYWGVPQMIFQNLEIIFQQNKNGYGPKRVTI